MTEFRTRKKDKRVYPVSDTGKTYRKDYDTKQYIDEKLETDRKENMQLFKKREKEYNKIKGIRVGDWVKEKNGDFTRVTHIWRDENNKPFQVQTGGGEWGQYYLGDGYISYSGSLDPGFDPNKVKVRDTNKKLKGSIWFFKNNHHVRDNAVEYPMEFRVFKVE